MQRDDDGADGFLVMFGVGGIGNQKPAETEGLVDRGVHLGLRSGLPSRQHLLQFAEQLRELLVGAQDFCCVSSAVGPDERRRDLCPWRTAGA